MALEFPNTQVPTITFSSGFFARLLSVGVNVNRGEIDTTADVTSGARTFKESKWYDTTIDVEGQLDTSTAADWTTPMTAAASSIVLTFPGGTGNGTWTFTGFLTTFNPRTANDQVMTFTATLRVSGTASIANQV